MTVQDGLSVPPGMQARADEMIE